MLLYILFPLLAVVYLVYRARQQKQYHHGPAPLPLLGNLPAVRRLRSDPDGALLDIRAQWGDLCMLWFGSQPVLIVSSARAVKEMLDERSAIYSSRPPMNAFRQRTWPFRLVSTPAGDDFRMIRKLYHNLLSPQKSLSFQKYQDHESCVLLSELLREPDMFMASVQRYTISVIFSVVYGQRIARLDDPFVSEFTRLLDYKMKYFEPGTLMIDFVPGLERLPLYLQPFLLKLTRLVERECDMLWKFFESLKAHARAGSAPDCFGKLLLDEQEKAGVSDVQAIHILAMLVEAGSDTTAAVLGGFFKIMALNPDAQRKAREEIAAHVGPDRLPTWTDEPALPYVRALIKEVHRWAPIGSLGIPHCATRPDVFRGRTIPAGTIVFPNLPALNTDPECFADADAFRPERHLGDDMHAAARATQKDPLARDHYHYGFGRRLCQGIHVAEASLFIVVARVLWAFEIREKKGDALSMKDKTHVLVWKHNPYGVDLIPASKRHEEIIRSAAAKADNGVPIIGTKATAL